MKEEKTSPGGGKIISANRIIEEVTVPGKPGLHGVPKKLARSKP